MSLGKTFSVFFCFYSTIVALKIHFHFNNEKLWWLFTTTLNHKFRFPSTNSTEVYKTNEKTQFFFSLIKILPPYFPWNSFCIFLREFFRMKNVRILNGIIRGSLSDTRNACSTTFACKMIPKSLSCLWNAYNVTPKEKCFYSARVVFHFVWVFCKKNFSAAIRRVYMWLWYANDFYAYR